MTDPPLPQATAEQDACFTAAGAWLADPQLKADAASTAYVCQHILASVEALLFRFALQGEAGTFKALPTAEITALELVLKYREVLDRFLGPGQAESPTRMRVELRSRELLVMWAAYCAAHASAVAFYAPLGVYGVPLALEDLRHLVLSDRLGVDAALQVAAYLRAWTKPDLAVFSLVKEGPTLDLAEGFFRSDGAGLLLRWAEEQRGHTGGEALAGGPVQASAPAGLARGAASAGRRAEGAGGEHKG